MTDELKPVRCGCGGEANIYAYEARWKKTEDGYQRSVGCLKCGIATQLYDTGAEAITAWNTAMSGSAEEKLKAFWDGMSAEMRAERTEIGRAHV